MKKNGWIKFTMEMGFYRNKLKEYNIETIIPTDKKDIEIIQNIIKNELGKGIVTKESKEKFINYANKLVERGAEGIVLGCTEIPMLIEQKDFNFPVFDTTKIHMEDYDNFCVEN